MLLYMLYCVSVCGAMKSAACCARPRSLPCGISWVTPRECKMLERTCVTWEGEVAQMGLDADEGGGRALFT